MSPKHRRGDAQRALLLALGLVLVRCTPDFDSLSNGDTQANSAGTPGGGSSSTGGDSDDAGAPVAQGGSTAGSLSSSGTSAGGTAGTSAVAGTASGGVSGAGGDAAMPDGGQAGAGPIPCTFKPNSTIFDGFDGGLDGAGFTGTSTTWSAGSTLGATGSSGWVANVGKTCPGSLHLAAHFVGYSSGTKNDEILIADLRFDPATWTGATALHGWIKVSPAMAPLAGVQFFVVSGSSFSYASKYDDHVFANGAWNEMVLPLSAGATFDPSGVLRIGFQVVLQRSGTAGIPPTPPPMDIWLDDVWLAK